MQLVEHVVHRAQLQRDFLVVPRRAVAVVIDEFREGLAVVRLRLPVLARMNVEAAQHAHLHVLRRLDVAVIHVRARVRRIDEIREARAHVDRDRRLRQAVEDRGLVGEAVKVHRVRIEKIRAHRHADVGHREIERLAFRQLDGGRGKVRGQEPRLDRARERHPREVGEAERVEDAAVRHLDEAVTRRQMHALDRGRRGVGNRIAIRIAGALHERRGAGASRPRGARNQDERGKHLAKVWLAHIYLLAGLPPPGSRPAAMTMTTSWRPRPGPSTSAG
jgi:hypothetical protein